MADNAINSRVDDAMILGDRYVHSELMLQRDNGNPTNDQATEYENETGNWIDRRSISKASNPLKTEKDTDINANGNGDPQNTE